MSTFLKSKKTEHGTEGQAQILCSLTHTETELVSILLFYGIFLKWEIGASKSSSCDFYELTYWAQNECDSRRDTYLW